MKTAMSIESRKSFFATLIFLVLACPSFAQAQTERLELGRRLQRFEAAWESADSQLRAECVPTMKSAVSNFFGLQLSAAGKNLDQAWQIARGGNAIGELEKFAVSQQLLVEPVCGDTSHTGMNIRLKAFYPTEFLPPDNSRLLLKLEAGEQIRVAEHEIQLSEVLAGSKWETGILSEGDYRLQAELKCNDQSFSYPDTTISRIDKFDDRRQALKQALVGAAGEMDDTVRATIRDTISVLTSLKNGEVQEADYPALARLRMCEALLMKDREPGELIAQLAGQSDVWLSLAKGRSSVPVRLRGPEQGGTPIPVLLLFHGAGGSENMFFETYGAGRVVEEGLKRGWLVVAPRQGLFGMPLDASEMLDVLDQLFEIDRSQVMLLGHSMGAAQVIRQTLLHPEIPVAAAALGGGNRVTDPTKLKPIAWFVGAGSDDFGKGGARQLHKSLESAGVSSAYHEYQDVEHMVIVQAAIDDVFKFLDKTLAERRRTSSQK